MNLLRTAQSLLCISFLTITTLHAVAITDVVSGTQALTTIALNADIAVVALTTESGHREAVQIPKTLHNLTSAMSTTLANDTQTVTLTAYDPTIEDTLTDSYGLFTNMLEELMIDLYFQKQVLSTYFQQRAVFRELVRLNATFANYSSFMQGLAGDILHQNITRNETRNAEQAILNVTAKYTQGPTRLALWK